MGGQRAYCIIFGWTYFPKRHGQKLEYCLSSTDKTIFQNNPHFNLLWIHFGIPTISELQERYGTHCLTMVTSLLVIGAQNEQKVSKLLKLPKMIQFAQIVDHTMLFWTQKGVWT